jgi:phospholipase/carboxylesterase
MDSGAQSLLLCLTPKAVEPRDEPSPTGSVPVENGPARGVLLTPEVIDSTRRYPLITVFHGAGRQDELIAKGLRDEPARRDALFFVPRSVQPTWDLIAGGPRTDLDFLEFAWDLIYRRYPIDFARQALMGYSDGASYALSIGLANPQHFSALIAWAAGFVRVDSAARVAGAKRPRIYLEYGSHDELFPFEHVALPMRANLASAGFDVTFSVDEGGRHWPSGSFQGEALDWYFDRATGSR